MQESKRLALAVGQCLPVRTCGLEQMERAFDVGSHESGRPVDTAVDMALGGKVHDRARSVFGQKPIEQGPVADVAAHEAVARVAFERSQIFQVAGVGECVEIDDRLVALREPVEHEVAADEAGAAGHEHGHARA